MEEDCLELPIKLSEDDRLSLRIVFDEFKGPHTDTINFGELSKKIRQMPK